MLAISMIKRLLFLISIVFLLSGCVNKHGVSAKYYSNCKEYYDIQGYYHKKCGDDDIFTYKDVADAFKEGKKEPNGNVW